MSLAARDDWMNDRTNDGMYDGVHDGFGDRVDVRDGTAAMLAAGCHRLAYVGTDDVVGAQRLAGFLDAHASAGLGVDEDLVVLGPRTRTAADAACRGLLKRPDPPHAIVVDAPSGGHAAPRGVLAAVAPGMVPVTIARVGSLPG